MKPSWMLAGLLALSTGVYAQPAKDAASAYALQMPIQLGPQAPATGGLYRLAVPAQALVKLQSPGAADMRVFDAQGLALPIALTAVASTQSQQQSAALVAYPIMGATDGGGASGLSLRIEEGAGKRVVQLDSAGKPAVGAQKVVGTLLDARVVKGLTASATALDVQSNIPNAQPVRFSLHASKDLQNWQSLGDAVFYRVEGTPMAASNRLRFAPFQLKDHYLRITWDDKLGDVSVQGATVFTGSANVSAARVAARINTTLTSPHEISFALPFATPIAALDIAPQGSNVLAPVRVLGRGDRSQPWRELASGVVYALNRAGVQERSSALELSPASGVREIKIEADTKTPGFAAPPAISLLFEPTQIVFLASGNAPYTLAAGQPQATSTYLPVQSLIPGYDSGAENKLPLASAQAADAPLNAPAVLVDTAPPSQTPATRDLVLWGVLIAGALALGVMAWVLMKQTKKPQA